MLMVLTLRNCIYSNQKSNAHHLYTADQCQILQYVYYEGKNQEIIKAKAWISNWKKESLQSKCKIQISNDYESVISNSCHTSHQKLQAKQKVDALCLINGDKSLILEPPEYIQPYVFSSKCMNHQNVLCYKRKYLKLLHHLT